MSSLLLGAQKSPGLAFGCYAAMPLLVSGRGISGWFFAQKKYGSNVLPLAHQGFPALAIRFFPPSSQPTLFFLPTPRTTLAFGVFCSGEAAGFLWNRGKGGISVVDMVDSSHIWLIWLI